MDATTVTAPAMNPGPQKEYGLNWLTPFMGDWTKIENFIQECDIHVYLAINEAIYDNEPAKVAFVLSFMTDKEALKWKEQYIWSITQNNRITFPTYTAFMTKLQEAFCVVNPVDAAMQKLALLQQGNRPVEAMITDFRLLIGEADLSTTSAWPGFGPSRGFWCICTIFHTFDLGINVSRLKCLSYSVITLLYWYLSAESAESH